MRFERSGRGQEPSRGHKFSILENVLSIRDFTSQTLASFPSDLVGVWQVEQAHHTASKEKQSVPAGERPVVHIAIVCGFNRKFYKQCNSQQLVCDMQFTVVANESNREL